MKATLKEAFRRVQEAAAVECPSCRTPIPFGKPTCPGCGRPPTLRSALKATFGQSKRNLNAGAKRPSEKTIRWFRWAYLIVSAIIVWMLLPVVDGHFAAQALSIIYLVILSSYIVWLVPKPWRRAYFWLAPPIVKLASTLNMLSLLMLLQVLIEIWWGRAVQFALLFVITFLAGYLFHVYVVPMGYFTYLLLIGGDDDDGGEQGRRVHRDRQ